MICERFEIISGHSNLLPPSNQNKDWIHLKAEKQRIFETHDWHIVF